MQIQRSLKKAIQNPEAVTGLDLRQAKPTVLFPEIERFINLEFIDLSNCTDLNWADACVKLSKLPKLTEIKAFGAGITLLPTEFGLLTSLKKIDFSSNALLTSLPDSFHALTSLERINFHTCGLTALPATPWHFQNLDSLVLSHNKLSTIPESFFEGMPLLKQLSLDDNQLTALPQSVAHLTTLEVFYAGCNPLKTLPENFAGLTNLNTLWLDSCPNLHFETIFEKLKHLPLRNLNLLGNQLSKLPSAVSELVSLEVLNINSNPFGDVWNTLKALAPLPLKQLDIRFMGDDIITLEQAREIIPTLQKIFSDTRTPEEYQSAIGSWLTAQFTV